MLQDRIDQFVADKKYIKRCRIVPRDIPLGQVHLDTTTIGDDGTEVSITRTSRVQAPNGTFTIFSSRDVSNGYELFNVERFYLRSGEIVEIRWDTVYGKPGGYGQEAAYSAEHSAALAFYETL